MKESDESKHIKIVVADESPIVLEGLSHLINTQNDLELIGKFSYKDEIIKNIEEFSPDLIILDIDFRNFDSIDLILSLKKIYTHLKAIIFTNNISDERVISAIKAGVEGYLLKKVPVEKILQAIRAVHNGEPSLHPEIASKLMKQTRSNYEELTKREFEILHLVAKGYSNKKIAFELYISERTVKFHISSIFFKLDVSNRTEAVTSAINKGLINVYHTASARRPGPSASANRAPAF